MSNLSPYFSREEWNNKVLNAWERSAQNSHTQSKKYSLVLPPPNVTGVLHMGHALCISIQDIFARYYRLKGRDVMWVPGADHAGIATQSVVERSFRANKEIVNSKEELIRKIWNWKEKSEKTIISQIKSIGASCAWNKYRFTMDEEYSKAVRHAFKVLFEKDLIYKGQYIINWDPILKTAISDDELEYEAVDSEIWYVKYKLFGSEDDYIEIATTRPETIVGDSAIAIHPEDERAEIYKGRQAINPITKECIPIIFDTAVDKDYGTGALKITPAHDKLDYEIGQRHNLDIKIVITPDQKVCEGFADLSGLCVDDARKKALEILTQKNLLSKSEIIKSRVAISYRTKCKIDTIISDQWFVRVESFKKKLKDILHNQDITIYPNTFVNTYVNWISNLKDWCISRQISWGHRIPVYTNHKTKEVKCFEGTAEEFYFNHDKKDWHQEEDVLDTWFSSAVWPFAVFGWPKNTSDLKKYFPIDIMVTGHDIIFFWVTRMLMMSIAFMKKLPFSKILLHGLLYSKSYWTLDDKGNINYIVGQERDYLEKQNKLPKGVNSKWEKISKSKGNVIDPMDVCKKYSEDSMRIGLISGSYLIPQIDIEPSRFEYGLSFVNKLWNVFKFVKMFIDEITENDIKLSKIIRVEVLSDVSCCWILKRFKDMIAEHEGFVERKDLTKAFKAIEVFFWEDFCSVYVECVKKSENKFLSYSVALSILKELIVLIHPFAPFVTEVLYMLIKQDAKMSSIVLSSKDVLFVNLDNFKSDTCMYDLAVGIHNIKMEDVAEMGASNFSIINSIAKSVRSIKGSMKIPANHGVEIFVASTEKSKLDIIVENKKVLEAISKVETVSAVEKLPNVFLGIENVMNVSIGVKIPEIMLKQEHARLEKEINDTSSNILHIEKRLNNKSFIAKAPKIKIEKDKDLLKEFKNRLQFLQKSFIQLSKN